MELRFELEEKRNLLGFFGVQNSNIKLVEKTLDIEIFNRGDYLMIQGARKNEIEKAEKILKELYQISLKKEFISQEEVKTIVDIKNQETNPLLDQNDQSILKVSGGKRQVFLKNKEQQKYLKKIMENDIVFGIGPAGTGKTFVAVAAGLKLLYEGKVKKIILTRPVIEAGENLGFLPGTLEDKIDPYLRPLTDAISDMLSPEEVLKYKERGQIEIAPLAYMRGRTLNNAFIILDEAQNTTVSQIKMFLTRLGYNSKAVITGDITQKDLPDKQKSGLDLTITILKEIERVDFSYFDKKDVVRHPIVIKVIEAFEKHEKN
ncbi:MAG TPA: phosphate starvation-inducible protein PhoH [Spirochaetia bacterium]|nr:MAG: hypothetical protein A2Y41_02580 [Spirochaetes bacterium GWB1_36_13]HCL57590.1 phosphate starvation-inducible protein PhoH [Spirochaetia bacterium]